MEREGKLFYGIGEVAKMLDVNPSLLRYWETEFPDLRPTKNVHGSRTYMQQDIALLRRIHYLTKECGLTLEGARQQLKNDKSPDRNLQLVDTLTELKNFLLQMKQNL